MILLYGNNMHIAPKFLIDATVLPLEELYEFLTIAK
jgi:hypothetical protein